MKFYNNSDITIIVRQDKLTVTRFSEKSFRLYNSKDANGIVDSTKEAMLENYGFKIFSRDSLRNGFFVGTSDYSYIGTMYPPSRHLSRVALQNHIENFRKLSMFFADNGEVL